MARSRDRFVFMFMIFAGFIWLAVVVMISLPGSNLRLSVEFDKSQSPDEWKLVGKDSSFRPPVIQRLDLDRLRFEEARKVDAAEKLRAREQEQRERQIKEDIERRKVLDRLVPPFKLAHNSPQETYRVTGNAFVARTSWPSNVDKENELQFNQLVQSGLIVPRWGDHPEVALDSKSPGEFGVDVNINKESLSDIEKKKFDDGWQRNAFNQYASDAISVHRSLPDVRDNECKSLKYHETLPDTSVIIIFHNEAWSTLLRTVHSVIDRSPHALLKEVILVDDFSDLEHLKKPLENYMEKLGKVYVLRAKSRQGLIRARLLGASRATGKVLTFLDSHCECARELRFQDPDALPSANPIRGVLFLSKGQLVLTMSAPELTKYCSGWLEPLLDRIAQNRSNVVTPIIDVLDDSTLRYQYSSARSTSVGGFDWNLQFNWHAIPAREMSRRKSAVEPVQTPTMAGGLFSIDKTYFEYLGAYDPGMDIWGGENLELSFRVWMCGGSLEIVLCSHVGHIFRKRSPYSWGTGVNVLKKNSIRLAEVWMDEAKKYYFDRLGNDLTWMCGGALEIVLCSHVGHIFRSRSPYKWRSGVNVVKKNAIRVAEVWMDDYKNYYFERFNFDLGDYGDVSARKELRKRLNCKSFKWYLTNIYPEMFVPGDALASGEIRNKAMGTYGGVRQPICLDSPADRNSISKPLDLWPCHNMGGNQYWMLSKNGEIRRDEACLDVSGDKVIIQNCHGGLGNQHWKYTDEDTLLHVITKRCLELSEDGAKISLRPCSSVDRQVWLFRRKQPETEVPVN